MITLKAQNGSAGFILAVQEGITLETQRKGAPAKLTFSVVDDEKLSIEEGCPVKLEKDGGAMFYGYVFRVARSPSRLVQITCYDQIRYLKNKDTYNFEKTTASRIIAMLAQDYGLTLGQVDETSFMIPAWVAEDKTLLDIMQEALEMELTNTRQLYILYDDAGKLCCRAAQSLRVPLVIDAETARTYDYESNIDENTYNRVILVHEDSKTKQRTVFEADGGNRKWGTLQYYEKISDDKGAQNRANMLLELYNAKTKRLTVEDAFGDARVRAGCSVPVLLTLGDGTKISRFMMVDTCRHTFRENLHLMTLKLMGGEFVG